MTDFIQHAQSINDDGLVVGWGRRADGHIEAVLLTPRHAAADLDHDSDVGFSDLLLLLSAWGPCPEEPTCIGDLTDDGDVDVDDLLIVLVEWGPCS